MKILSWLGFVAKGVVVIVTCLDAYPCDRAVTVADRIFPSICAAVFAVKLAVVYVLPSGITMFGVTSPIVVFEQESVTCTPSLGALAGEPLES